MKNRIRLCHRYYHWRKAGCIFIHVPKAAGTSINHAIYGRTLGHYRIETLTQWFPKLVDNSFVFSVVRDPMERLYSAYRFAKAGKTRDMGISNPQQYQIPEFDSFERFILEWLNAQNLESVDYVFQRQSDFLCRNNVLAVDYLGHLESIDSDLRRVSGVLGRHVELQNLNQTRSRASKAPTLTSSARDIVYETYQRDYQLLGYSHLLPN